MHARTHTHTHTHTAPCAPCAFHYVCPHTHAHAHGAHAHALFMLEHMPKRPGPLCSTLWLPAHVPAVSVCFGWRWDCLWSHYFPAGTLCRTCSCLPCVAPTPLARPHEYCCCLHKCGAQKTAPLSREQKATLEADMLQWASSISHDMLVEQRANAAKEKAEKEAAAEKNMTKEQKDAKQKQEIDRLLSALKSAKQNIASGGAGGAAEPEGARERSQTTPSRPVVATNATPVSTLVSTPQAQPAQSAAATNTPASTSSQATPKSTTRSRARTISGGSRPLVSLGSPQTPSTPVRNDRSGSASPSRSPRKDPLETGAVASSEKEAIANKYKVAAERRKKKEEDRKLKAQDDKADSKSRLEKEAERRYNLKKKEAADRRDRQKKLEQAVIDRRTKLAEERQAKAEAVRQVNSRAPLLAGVGEDCSRPRRACSPSYRCGLASIRVCAGVCFTHIVLYHDA